jgi:hypothetical protein
MASSAQATFVILRMTGSNHLRMTGSNHLRMTGSNHLRMTGSNHSPVHLGKRRDARRRGHRRIDCQFREFRKAHRSRSPRHLLGWQPSRRTARTCFEGPFGEVIRKTGTMANACPFRFSTKHQDEETDLLYYGYRYQIEIGSHLNIQQ